jgi:hypothetical protein
LLIATPSVPVSEPVTKSYKRAVRQPMSVTLRGAVYNLLNIPCVISNAPLFRPKINLTIMATFIIPIERHIS